MANKSHTESTEITDIKRPSQMAGFISEHGLNGWHGLFLSFYEHGLNGWHGCFLYPLDPVDPWSFFFNIIRGTVVETAAAARLRQQQ